MNTAAVVDKIDKAVKKSKLGNTSSQYANEGHLTGLIHSVMRLAIFALEKGRLPEEVDLAKIYSMWRKKIEQQQSLDENEIVYLGEYYRILEIELSPVTAVSLRATDCTNFSDCMKSEAGKFAKSQWLFTYVVFAVIISINLYQYIFEFLSPHWAKEWPDGLIILSFVYKLSSVLVPFSYGTLGACAHVLRLTDQRIRERTFDPRKVPEHRNRLVLGTLSGGIIVMFISAGEANAGGIALTAAALGFLAGYSTDFLFAIIDRILKAVLPNDVKSDDSKGVKTPKTKTAQQDGAKGVRLI